MEFKREELKQEIKEASAFVERLKAEVGKVIVGQEYMVERILIGILTNGHILVEGVPGLAKTTAVKAFSSCINTKFRRIQFTPDLLPADLLGTQIYQPKTGEFSIRKGPIFTNILLADEINRAPAKVQSALLESMQEKQVTIGEETFKLEDPFLVLATQNPIEQEGTYPLPEAQVDRFMLKLKVTYPNKKQERAIMDRVAEGGEVKVETVITPAEILKVRETIGKIIMEDSIKDYIVDLVMATRDPKLYNIKNVETLIQYGASPRATIFLNKAARAYAFIRGREYVRPQDVKDIGYDILRHRLVLTYEAEAEELSTDDVIKKIFDSLPTP